jgi:hypothetical protein
MAEAAKAKRVLGDNYPIAINNLVPDVRSCECGPGDSITFTATGQSCIVVFEGLPLGIPLDTSNTSGVIVFADSPDHIVHWGVEAWTPGAKLGVGSGTTPYRIQIGSTDGGNS